MSKGVVVKTTELENMDYLPLAKKCVLFKELEKMDFQAILRCLFIRIKEFKAGEIIEYEGNHATNAYLVLDGRCRTIYFDEKGNALPGIDYIKDNIYGLEYIDLKNATYKEEFYAVSDSVLIVINLFKLLTPCENKCLRHYVVLDKCIREYAKQLDVTKDRIKVLGQSKTRDKVLTFLNNNINKKNVFVKLPYNRQEMASYLGVDRSALSLELSKLKKEGLIEYKKNLFMLK